MKSYIAGVDVGSTTSKCVIMDLNCTRIVGSAVMATIANREASARAVLEEALKIANTKMEELAAVGSTGYGRRALDLADTVLPEVICHGYGTDFFVPGVRTIVDIGGQDSKIILCRDGKVERFEMNDKCAAGTGRFFEVLSNRLLNVPIGDLGELALASENPIRLSCTCTVFAESEIVSLLSQGVSPADICKGILLSTEKRIVQLARASSVDFEDPIVMTGGFARNIAAAPTFGELIGRKVLTIDEPQLPAAVGVAIAARNGLTR